MTQRQVRRAPIWAALSALVLAGAVGMPSPAHAVGPGPDPARDAAGSGRSVVAPRDPLRGEAPHGAALAFVRALCLLTPFIVGRVS